MKLIVVEYPFCLDPEPDTDNPPEDFVEEFDKCKVAFSWNYPTMRQALSDARDRFQARDEYEDAQDLIQSEVDPLSRKTAKVFEIDVTVMRSWVCDILNTGMAKVFDGGVHVNDLRYRKGRIVTSKPVMADSEEPVESSEGV